MIYTRLFEYDSSQESNSYRGTDYTRYIMLGDTNEDKLNEVLGTVELTLAGLPRSEEFTPKMKFIYEVWQGEPEATDSYLQSFHVIVQEDLVTKPILSDDNYYDHHITFVEASAIAQSYVVDNIAVTYELSNITLDAKNAIDLDLNVSPTFENTTPHPISSHNNFYINNSGYKKEYSVGKKMVWDENTKSLWEAMKYYQIVPQSGTSTVTVPVPMLEILNGRSTNTHSLVFDHLGYCSLVTTVIENDIAAGTSTVVNTLITNPARTAEEAWNYDNNWDLNTTGYVGEEGRVLEGFKYSIANILSPIVVSTRTTKVAEYEDVISNRQISIQVRPNCTYSITTTLKNNFAYYSHGYAEEFLVYKNIKNDDPTYYTNNDYPVATMTFATYSESDYGKVMFHKAPKATAYDLFQKAQITTQNIRRGDVPINETEQTFYLQPKDKSKLQNTEIIENFYNQKNFWEILLDIGKYIHSIPKIKFGENDRFVVEWRQLGNTQQRDDATTQISIFNSRSMENYIAACTSYVTNMVQLGGVIDEWVAPKSSSEDYLVYNDVAEIKTSKPIIEIVKMEAKCINNFMSYDIDPNHPIRNLTPENENGYVFEENVYNCLGIDWPYTPDNQGVYSINWSRVACKGFAIYYELGTNIIKGLSYQLPTKNTGDYPSQYSIKNILGVLFGIGLVGGEVKNSTFNAWNSIKVNDFVFHIVYRTKDTVRTDQIRPDFKKYLLSSKFDRVPQHNQFNNQTDIVCDSVKFGNNIYGKLIRTGNTEYTTTEWCDNLYATKNVGELYKIRGELYYVATVKNTNYKTHIISEVTFSKDYNQLSEIIGIPSEPRFYEISEQSSINREVVFNEYIVLGTQDYSDNLQQYFVQNKGWEYINKLLFQNESEFPKYAITVFKNDAAKKSDINGNETFYKEICTPINTYSVQNTLTMEWDMEDNFSAGDKVIPTTDHKDAPATDNNAYNKLFPVQYTDVYGRSDLVDFIVLSNIDDMTANEIQSLPESPYRLRFTSVLRYIGEMVVASLPSGAELDQFVINQTGSTRIKGDGIMVADADDFFLYYYNGYRWDIYRNTQLSDYEVQIIHNGEFDWSKRPLTYSDDFPFSSGNLIYNISTNTSGIGLLKDNREALHLNFNLQMITEDDSFILSSYLWQPKKGSLRLALLKNEINKISNDTIPYSSENVVSDEFIIHAPDPDNPNQYIDNTFSAGSVVVQIENILTGIDLTDVKALAIVSDNLVDGNPNSGERYFVMGRNITGLTEQEAKMNWYISNYNKEMFPHQ